MNGEFVKKKPGPWLIMLALGLYLIGTYIYEQVTGAETPSGGTVSLVSGSFLLLSVLAALLWNLGARIRIENGTIQAKFHWFGRLNCPLADIAFALPQLNTVSLLMKNGKRYDIGGVANPWSVCSAIRRETFSPEKASPEALARELDQLPADRKKGIFWVIGCTAAMFAWIFLAVFLTGDRALSRFGTRDWVILGGMAVLELVTVTALFLSAEKTGRLLMPMEQLKYRQRGAVIFSQALPGGSVHQVYTDENYNSRVCVCGFPKDEGIYYCVEEFQGGALMTVRTSQVFPSREALTGFEVLIDVTNEWLQE